MAHERSTCLNPMTFSASRIGTWINCEVKAGFQYIAGYEDPGTEDTEFGTEVHTILEKFKRDGVPINMMTHAGAVAAEAIPYVEHFRGPREGGNARFEGDFTFRARNGKHNWRGAIDISAPGEVNDYKTTSDFKWAKTPDQLLHDPQAVLYAMKEFERWGGPTVKLRWLYLRKRAPYAAKSVEVTMTREHAERAFAALERITDRFQAAAAAAPDDPTLRHRFVLDTLTPNFDHCSAFRGCPHRSRCPSAPFFPSPNQGQTPMNDILAQLQAMDAAAAAGVPLPAMRTEAPPLMGVPVPALLQAPPPAPVVQTTAAGSITTFDPSFLLQPDAPPTLAPANDPAAVEAERQENMRIALAKAEEARAGEPPVVAGADSQINPPKRGRGRPRKDAAPSGTTSPTMVGVPALQHDTIPAPPPAPVQIAAVAPAPPPPIPALPSLDGPPRARIGTLYVGCRPTTAGALDFNMLVAKAKIAIGPATYYAGYGYKANGMLLQMIDAIIQHDKPAAVVVPDPAAQEATICMSLLYSLADNVVEALR